MDVAEQHRLLKSSRELNGKWYLESYPEVAALGLDPVDHYLRYGAEMGRNPGRGFDTRHYTETHPDTAASGLNPLVHYVLHGRDRGYSCRPPGRDPNRQIQAIRTRLLSFGFTEGPLADLRQVADASPDPEARALAAQELALWHMRDKTATGWRAALDDIARARADAPDRAFRSRLAIAELLCHYGLGDHAAGRAAYDRAALDGEVTPDVLLAWVNFQPTVEGRLAWVNATLARYGIEPVALLPDGGQPAYDRLTAAALPRVEDGPKVSVLIAAFEAEAVLPTALRSLQEQTWANLEIIVIDDASPSPGTVEVAHAFAALDPRIRVLRMTENAGAYVARNRGLDEATGEFVTLHDADDWSHPRKIETQVRFLQQNSSVIGCTSEQARCTDSLDFLTLRHTGGFVVFNTSSFLWRRAPVRAELGYWDTVRFGADSEFIRRVQVVFGKHAVARIPTGPLSFQRESKTSVTGDPVKGLDSLAYGVRREYQEAHDHFHRSGKSLKYDNVRERRPFPAPPMISGHPQSVHDRVFDLVVYCDATDGSPAVESVISVIAEDLKEGSVLGIVNVPDPRRAISDARVDARVRKFVSEGKAEIIVYGDACSARRILRLTETDETPRLLPSIHLVSAAGKTTLPA